MSAANANATELRGRALGVLRAIDDLILANLGQLEQRRYDIQYKSDGSPVTAADTWLEGRIFAHLCEALPSIRLIGEESFSGTGGVDGLVAVVDPIDGTENFCSGLKEWGVSVGIWLDGDHVASLLLLPELGLRLVSGDRFKPFSSRITGFSSSYCDAIGVGISNAVEYRVSGCAVYNLYSVIRGSFSRFINPKGARVWDLLPGLALALEHGCEVLLDDHPYDGRLLEPAKRYRVDIRHRYDFHPR